MSRTHESPFPRRGPTVLLALLALGPAAASAQGITTMPAPQAEVAPAAEEALRTAIAVSRKSKTLGTLGLRSADEAKRATLGAPIPIREVGYDRLLAWKPGADPESVFVGPPQVLYPVMVGSEARSALTLVRKEAGWELTGYGDVERIASIFLAREALRKDAGGAADQTSLVAVPAFRLELVAETRGDRTLLRPVVPAAAADAGIRGTTAAPQAIEVLAAHAREYDQRYGDAIRERRLVH